MNAIKRSYLVVALAALALSGCSRAEHLPRTEQTVSGVTIEIGIVPASQLGESPHQMGSSSPKTVASEASQSPPLSHLTVALLDMKSGKHITDARIQVGVGHNANEAEPSQWLQAMPINGMMSYGGLIDLTGGGPWHIHLRIYRSGAAKPIDAVFGYQSPED